MALKLSKAKVLFRCQECGAAAPKWQGRCGDCGKWNSLAEEAPPTAVGLNKTRITDFSSDLSLLSEVSTGSLERVRTGVPEFDRMIGGGIVPGSFILLGGSPGVGKSTLMLQIAARLGQEHKVLYVSGEESREQIKGRADRLGAAAPRLFLLSETGLENILEAVRRERPEFLVIDSIQTTYRSDLASAPGSVGQVRECAAEFLRCAKAQRVTVFVLGHVTKEGDLAGPRVLEHIVDTVLYFESEKHQTYRILRATKNRFGPTSEIGIFEMSARGLEEVPNPSRLFLSQHRRAPGSVIVAAMEGSRPLLIEIQALVSRSYFGLPRRMVSGIDFNRALITIAVLEKRCGLNLSSQDVFVNVAGGVKAKEPAADLGCALAIAGAFGNFAPESDGAIVGEVGLGGEVRGVGQLAERLKEAERLGLSWALAPRQALKRDFKSETMPVTGVETVEEAIRWLRARSQAARAAEV